MSCVHPRLHGNVSRGIFESYNQSLPFSCLPRQEEGGGKDRIRVVPGEGPDVLVEAFQSDATVLICHLSDNGAFSEPGDMSC